MDDDVGDGEKESAPRTKIKQLRWRSFAVANAAGADDAAAGITPRAVAVSADVDTIVLFHQSSRPRYYYASASRTHAPYS